MIYYGFTMADYVLLWLTVFYYGLLWCSMDLLWLTVVVYHGRGHRGSPQDIRDDLLSRIPRGRAPPNALLPQLPRYTLITPFAMVCYGNYGLL